MNVMSDITSRIDYLLVKTHQRRADLVRGTGVAESTIRGWISGRMPSADNLYSIGKYFGVTVEWLLTGEGDEELNREREKLRQSELEIEQPLNFQERKLLESFRKLDERDRNSILMMTQTLCKNCSQ